MNDTARKKYNYHVFWSNEDRAFVGVCEEFPSLSWITEDEDETFKGIKNLIENYIVEDIKES